MTTLPIFTGAGFLGGEAPDGLTTVAGVPISARVDVLWRDPVDQDAQEVLVQTTQSAADGTWRVVGVNPALQYVVRGIKAGYDDATVVNVVPAQIDVIEWSGAFASGVGVVEGALFIDSGLPPYSVSASGLPAGFSAQVEGRKIVIEGSVPQGAVIDAMLHVVAANSVSAEIPVSLTVQPALPRWWRIRFTVDTSTIFGTRTVQLAEFWMDGVLPLIDGVPIASHSYEAPPQFALSNAFDGVIGVDRMWDAAGGSVGVIGRWIGFRFNEGRKVNSVSMAARPSGNAASWSPRGFVVESSHDGVTWDLEWSVPTVSAWTSGQQRTFARPS